MADMSNYLENAILNLILNGTAFTAITDPYISLHTADPTDAGTGTEVSGTGYARVQGTFPTASGTTGSVTNSADITWASAGSSWGTVGWIGVWDAGGTSGGNMLLHTAMDATKTIDTGDVFKIATPNLTIAFT